MPIFHGRATYEGVYLFYERLHATVSVFFNFFVHYTVMAYGAEGMLCTRVTVTTLFQLA